MARKLRPLTLPDLVSLPLGCACCSFWESPTPLDRRCRSGCDEEFLRSWYDRVTEEWGDCGRVVAEDDEVLGFVKYAPSMYFPQVFTFPVAPDDPSVPFIACVHVDPESRRHGLGKVLVQAALRDLALRGERHVFALAEVRVGESAEDSPLVDAAFLEKLGFSVNKPHPRYPLMRLELRSLAMLTENLETVLESLRLPLTSPRRAPVPGA